MMWFCNHKWVEVSRDYTPPITGSIEGRLSVDVTKELIAGTTHVYLKCENCHDIKQKDLVGKYG